MKTKILASVLLACLQHAGKAYSPYEDYNVANRQPIYVNSTNWQDNTNSSGYLYPTDSGSYYGNVHNWNTNETKQIRILDYGDGQYRLQEWEF